eukprot:scaffold4472_cov37-Tisochrysis_lutea.AAC.3
MELARANWRGVVVEGVYARVRSCVPQLDRLVVARREDEAAVGRTLCITHPVGVPREGVLEALCRDGPQLDRLVIGRGNELLAVSREGDAAHGCRVRPDGGGLTLHVGDP